MSHDKWVYPTNTEDKLWISNADEAKSFGELFEAIQCHFGPASTLGEFSIEVTRWTYEESCSCCRDSGTYGQYYEITKLKELDEYTVNRFLSELHQE